VPYPDAPWTLHGHALLSLHLVDTEIARSTLPPELNLISVLPGKTLGGVYLSRYGTGSVLEYSELIVVSGIAQYGSTVGAWISQIYVDNSDSLAGGREIWGLPKELADFRWEFAHQSEVTVRQGDRTLCRLSYGAPVSLWRQPIAGTSFSQLATGLVNFRAEADLRPGLVSAHLTVPMTSPFAQLRFEQSWLTLLAQELRLVVQAPSGIGPERAQSDSNHLPV
jgi:hypothetical protein